MIKGENIIIGEQSKLNLILVDINWKISTNITKSFEIDAFAFLLNEKEKVRNDSDFIFYNDIEINKNKFIKHLWKNIKHNSNNEKFEINLKEVPQEIKKIVFGLSIYKAKERKQNFNHINNLEINLLDNKNILSSYQIEYNEESINSMILGEIYKYKNYWKFKAINQGFIDELKELENYFGVNC